MGPGRRTTSRSPTPTARADGGPPSTLARAAGWAVQDGGTMVVVEGPRFSTRAPAQAFAAAG